MTSNSKRLMDLSAFITKGATPTTYGFRWESSGVRFLRSECVSARGLDLTQSMFISEAANRVMSRSEISDGDLLMTITGNVGRIVRVQGLSRANINQHIARIRLTSSEADSGYVYHYLSQPGIRNYFETITTGQAYPQISLSQVRDTEIPLPPIKTQRRVAETLTAVDDSIACLERLIAKKQAIKQGMLQQLLTGKRRLPGFSGAWVDGNLSDVLKVKHGRSQHAVETPNGRYPILGTGGVIGRTDTPLYSRPSVLIGRKGTIDRPQYRDAPFWTVDTLFFTEVNPSADPRFLFFVFTTVDWRSMNEASGVPSLNASRVSSVALRIPPLEEQRAIASVLRDCELEIEAVQRKVTRFVAIKQGMMQELLTGRTRLMPLGEAA
jgi:type I restriction enzyme S subunit